MRRGFHIDRARTQERAGPCPRLQSSSLACSFVHPPCPAPCFSTRLCGAGMDKDRGWKYPDSFGIEGKWGKETLGEGEGEGQDVRALLRSIPLGFCLRESSVREHAGDQRWNRSASNGSLGPAPPRVCLGPTFAKNRLPLSQTLS